MTEETEEKTSPKKIEDTIIIEEPAKDLYELYMIAKTRLSYVKTMRERYHILLDLIDNGCNMLPDYQDNGKQKQIEKLRGRARKILQKETNVEEGKEKIQNIYPSTRNTKYKRIERDAMGIKEPIYIYSITGEGTGEIEVEPKDLEKGFVDSQEQQYQYLIPNLMQIHNEIQEELLKGGILDVFNPTPKDFVRRFLREEMQKYYTAKEEENKEEDKEEEVKEEDKKDADVS